MLTQPDTLVVHRMYVLCLESRLNNLTLSMSHVLQLVRAFFRCPFI